MLLPIANLTQPDFVAKAAREDKMQFVTITFSNFGEFSRFALIIAEKPFEEFHYSPGVHALPTLKLRMGGDEKFLNSSSRMSSDPGPSPVAVPVAVLPDGKVLLDSWEIAQWAMPNSHVDGNLKFLLDSKIGPLTRTFIYYFQMKQQNERVMDELWKQDAGFLWQTIYSLGFKHKLRHILSSAAQITGPETLTDCVSKLLAAFEEVAQFLPTSEDKYIDGDAPGLADVALAALASPAVLPREYCGGRGAEWFDLLLAMDAECAGHVEALRETAVGRRCLRLYRTHRPTLPGFQTKQ